MKRRVLFALTLLVIGSTGVGAAAVSPWASLAEPVFLRVDTRELPEGVVEALAQDATGFLWVGTQGGLARYDGYHFKSYLPNPGDPKALPDGYIRSLLKAPGGLWIGTDSAGLVRFDTATETFTTWRDDSLGRRGPRSATIFALADATGGGLWIGGDAGLDSFDPRSGGFTPVPFTNGVKQTPLVRAILVDRNGTVWIAADTGLYRRDAAQTRFSRFALPASSKNEPVHVRSVYEDREGSIWAGGVDALYVLDRARHVRTVLRSSPNDATTIVPGPQFSIVEPAAGTIWVGSSDGGLAIVDVATMRVRRITTSPEDAYGLTAGRLAQFLRDRSGLIWLANHSGGLLLYNPLGRGAYALARGRLGMGDTGATAVSVHGKRLWAGGAHGVLVGLEPNAPAIHVNVPNSSTIAGLTADSSGKLWIGTINGLCTLDPGQSPVQCPGGPKQIENQTIVWTIYETPDAFWIGTGAGLYVANKRSGTVTVYRHGTGPDGLTSDLIGGIVLDRKGYVWAGTANGLNRIDPRTHRVMRYRFDPHNANSLGPGSNEWILQDRTGRLWVGMNGGPLNVIADPDGHPQFRRLGRSDGLPHENVDGLAQDASGRIWASTDNGLASIDPVTLRARPFGEADGVFPSNYWGGSVAQASDGTIFFGADDGVSVIAPEAASPWTYAPPVVLTSLKAGERALPLATNVTLQPGARDVTAEFAALDYSDPPALQYQYRLDGFDRDWIHTDVLHRIATYTNLPPGSYVLRVRATNRLGVWSPGELAVKIDALPAWYETWWFRILMAIAGALAILGIMQLRTAALRRHAQELEAMVQERTRELEEASLRDPLTGLRNRRFLTQIIHEEVQLALRRHDDLLFFMIDIDHFKAVNDTYGHHAGDQVLVQVRERLQRVFRESDYLVRWGGEEFLIVTRGSPRGDAPEIAERVRVEVERQPFTLDSGQSVLKTVSIGFAAFPLDPAKPHAVTWQQVIDLADRALYVAKQSGRNQWRAAAETVPATDPAVDTRRGP